jgi:23S rRNA pseudouridine2605 synthase
LKERLQKLLARRGVSSRRGAEEMIRQGRISVNGRTAELGQLVDPDEDDIRVGGNRVSDRAPHLYIALHKPVGYVTSLRSTHGEPTVLRLINTGRRLHPVGRLDKDTSGLLLMTDDGDWTNLITHPRYGIEKEYLVVVRGSPSDADLQRLASGVLLSDGTRTAQANVRRTGQIGGDTSLTMTMVEGKKRQIRLMCRSVGHEVIRLRRERIGPITLGQLGEGRWRELESREVEGIREEAHRRSATRSS